MNRKELVFEFNKAIKEIYIEEKLQCLSKHIKGNPIYNLYFDLTNTCNIKSNSKFNYRELFEDLIMCSDELLYFTAQLFLYRPLITNPVGHFRKENEFSENCIRFTNIETFEVIRYYMIVDVVYQKLYNFWDRIGDLINALNIVKLNSDRVYFSSAFNNIHSEYHSLEEYIWLKEFNNNKYKVLNKERKQIVHYTTTSTTFKKDFFNNTGNVKEWIDKRNYYADYFKDQIDNTILGFEKTLTLFEKIANKNLSNNN